MKNRIGVAVPFFLLATIGLSINCPLEEEQDGETPGFNYILIETDCHLEVFLLGSHLTSFIRTVLMEY